VSVSIVEMLAIAYLVVTFKYIFFLLSGNKGYLEKSKDGGESVRWGHEAQAFHKREQNSNEKIP